MLTAVRLLERKRTCIALDRFSLTVAFDLVAARTSWGGQPAPVCSGSLERSRAAAETTKHLGDLYHVDASGRAQ